MKTLDSGINLRRKPKAVSDREPMSRDNTALEAGLIKAFAEPNGSQAYVVDRLLSRPSVLD